MLLSICLAVGATGCKKSAEDKEASAAAAVAPTKVAAAAAETPAAVTSGIEWIHDDYPAALARAKETNRPIVIDMWAPWCHTCLSMQHYILIDPGLADRADRFVWLAIDTDKEKNAPVVAKFPVSAWPTFFVVGPDESIGARHLGSATVKQFRGLLDQGERGVREGDDSLAEGSPLWHVRDGDRKAAGGDPKAAAAAYGAAIGGAPAEWPRRAEILVSWISALHKAGDTRTCFELGARLEETVSALSASTADFAYYANACAKAVAGDVGAERANQFRANAVTTITRVLEDETAGLSIDDRSDGWRIVRELHLGRGDEAVAVAVAAAEVQRQLLDDAAEEAQSAHAAMTYNWPRSEVYVYLGRGEDLLADLEKSAAALPTEYDPPYRLAWVLSKLGRYDEALAAAKKAKALVYGPRKGRVLELMASIHQAAGDQAAERKLREATVAHYESMPDGQRSDSAIARAKKALAGD